MNNDSKGPAHEHRLKALTTLIRRKILVHFNFAPPVKRPPILPGAFIFLLSFCDTKAQPTASGKVTNLSSGSAVSGVDIDVFDTSAPAVTVGNASTDSEGNYTVDLPGPGNYLIRADMKTGEPLADQYYGGGIRKSTAQPVTISSASSTVTGMDIALPAGFPITGTITASGNPLPDIDIDVFSAEGEFLGSYPAKTAGNGGYEAGALPNGSYFVRADPDPSLGQFYVEEFFGESSDISQATAVTVNNGFVSGVDISLSPGGVISGVMRDSGGSTVEGVDLDIFDATGARLPFNATSGMDGTYFMGPLPEGSYLLRADPNVQLGLARKLYPDTLRTSQATPIAVTTDQTTGGIDFSLSPAGTISGIISDNQTDLPISEVDLDVFNVLGQRLDLTAKTATDGTYLIRSVPPGPYRIRADPSVETPYVDVYYDDASNSDNASPVTVQAGVNTGNINFKLNQGGWVAGVIRDGNAQPLEAIDLDIFDAAGNRVDSTTRSLSDGSYRLGALSPGNYFVRADPDAQSGFLDEYYNGSFDILQGTPVTVSLNSTTNGIDFNLPPSGWIEGLITNATGTPLPGIDLDVFDGTTLNRLTTGGTTGTDGRYLIGPLPVQDLIVRADPDANLGLVREYFSEQLTQNNANPVTVNSGNGTGNINFTLEQGFTISGTIRDLLGGGPIAGVDIDVFRQGDLLLMDQNAKTAADGSFTVGPLPPGTYLILADAQQNTLYADTFYVDASNETEATPVVVDGADITGIDVQLGPDAIKSTIEIDRSSDPKTITFRVSTAVGRTYEVEFSDSLQPNSWSTVTTLIGSGAEQSHIIELTSNLAVRFYRIRARSP